MKAVDLGLSVYWGENILEIPNKHFEDNLFTWGDDSYNNAHNKAYGEDDYEELADSGIITDDGFLTPNMITHIKYWEKNGACLKPMSLRS